MNDRSELIEQLRYALYLAESPETEYAVFEVGESEFEFDFTQDKDDEW